MYREKSPYHDIRGGEIIKINPRVIEVLIIIEKFRYDRTKDNEFTK